MRRALLAFALAALAPACAPQSAADTAGAPEPGAVGPCEVLYLVDGDTVDLDCSAAGAGDDLRVRLLRIDTPERGKPGYRRSSTALALLLLGRPVWLVFEEPGEAKRDRWGRLLAYLFVDGGNANVEMVRQGWSEFDTTYGRGRFARDFEAAAAERR